MTIYIGNLSFQAEQEHLFDLFSEYGEVKNCSLPLDRETGRKRGFAFVEMVKDEDEQKAIDDLQDVEWMGRMIRVSKATPRERSGGPRGGGGGGYRGSANAEQRSATLKIDLLQGSALSADPCCCVCCDPVISPSGASEP